MNSIAGLPLPQELAATFLAARSARGESRPSVFTASTFQRDKFWGALAVMLCCNDLQSARTPIATLVFSANLSPGLAHFGS
jgi:hypothetical protein